MAGKNFCRVEKGREECMEPTLKKNLSKQITCS